jgi:hypothetical protein
VARSSPYRWAPEHLAMDPLSSVAVSAATNSAFGVGVLKTLLDNSANSTLALINGSLNPQVGRNLDIGL